MRKVWWTVDCGVAVNPGSHSRADDGAIGYGLGQILYAQVRLDKGDAVEF